MTSSLRDTGRNAGHNRKLLVSVFDPQEAREAVLGGARIVDSEDPRSALGNIKPQAIMDVSDAVLNYTRDQEVQLSTNIGEDQLLFRRTDSGHAVEKSPYEIAGKASQAALGVAVSMGTRVHPCNIIKVGLDGMHLPILKDVLTEVVRTLNRTEQFSHSQVMSVLFVQDLVLWRERKDNPLVVRELVALREFSPTTTTSPIEGMIDLLDYYQYLTGPDGGPLFPSRPTLEQLIEADVLPSWSDTTQVKINEPYPHSDFGLTPAERTDREAIKKMVDATADAGADGIMLDTSILFKVARVGLVDTTETTDPDKQSIVDFNRFDISGSGPNALVRKGILSVEDIRFFVDYCHYRGVEANLAGSLQSYHAQQLWRLVPLIDQVSTRGGSSAIQLDPSEPPPDDDHVASRRDQVMMRQLVRGLVPPEQGGYFWLPKKMRSLNGVDEAIARLYQTFPDITSVFWADEYGVLEPSPQGDFDAEVQATAPRPRQETTARSGKGGGRSGDVKEASAP